MTKTNKSTPAASQDIPLISEDQIRAMSEDDYMNAAQLAFFKARLQQLEKDLLKNAGETTEHLRETVLVPDPADRATIEEEHALENFTPAQKAEQDRFIADFKVASPDFQDEHGYEDGPFTPEVLTMGSPHITHAFGCLALTLELPFKDNANDPDPQTGWSGARSAALGAAVLQPILSTLRA